MRIHFHPLAALAMALSIPFAGCQPNEHTHEGEDGHEHAAEEAETWAVTAWGERYEIFPEVDALVAGETALSHTHVTVLDGFAPLVDGSVEIVLRAGAAEQAFRADEILRPGIFNVEIQPESPGEFELLFRVTSAAGPEEIVGGRVRVGTADAPGGLISTAEPPAGSGGEPLPFLKEEQWRTAFSTAWVQDGSLPQSIEGMARVRPPAGGEATVTAPVDAVLLSDPWPYPGRHLERGEPLLRLVPRIAPERSLPALDAERATLETELETAEARLERLRGLLEVEATSQRELDEARTRVLRLRGTLAAAERDLEAARSSREGGNSGALTVSAPFSGEISAVYTSPGEVLGAGAPLARIVKTDSVWLEVAVPPEGGRRLAAGVSGVVLTFPEGASLRLEEAVRAVSIAPEADPRTGTVSVLLEVPPTEALILGTTAAAQILLAEATEGIVVPSAALVDDGGVTVAYVQLSGEEFARQPVTVKTRQGERAIVEGLLEGQRLVTRGGESIRRSSLLATGEAQGHVH